MKNYIKTLLISGLIGGSMMVMFSCDKQSNEDMKSENAVIECIMSRKSVRQFENREVGNDTIEKITLFSSSAMIIAISAITKSVTRVTIITCLSVAFFFKMP